MRRRDVMALLAGMGSAAAWFPFGAWSQTSRRARVGFLSGVTGAQRGAADVVEQSLKEFGWRTGHNLDFDQRYAEGDVSRFANLARELVALRPDVLVATGIGESKALQAATHDIPIVFMLVPDPVSVGLVENIARPGGNITGMSAGPQLLWSKRIALLGELLERKPRRLAWLANPAGGSDLNWAEVKAEAEAIGAEIERAEVTVPDDLEPRFERLNGHDAVLVQFDFLLFSHRRRVIALATQHRLPTVFENRFSVEDGGLLSYGADLRDNFRRAALYVDRILRGARPADLPVDQASRFELVINLKTARYLGLDVPPSLLARADEVIE